MCARQQQQVQSLGQVTAGPHEESEGGSRLEDDTKTAVQNRISEVFGATPACRLFNKTQNRIISVTKQFKSRHESSAVKPSNHLGATLLFSKSNYELYFETHAFPVSSYVGFILRNFENLIKTKLKILHHLLVEIVMG